MFLNDRCHFYHVHSCNLIHQKSPNNLTAIILGAAWSSSQVICSLFLFLLPRYEGVLTYFIVLLKQREIRCTKKKKREREWAQRTSGAPPPFKNDIEYRCFLSKYSSTFRWIYSQSFLPVSSIWNHKQNLFSYHSDLTQILK